MRKRINLTTQYIIIVCMLLLVVNVVLGVVLMNQSGKTMKALIRKHMISVADTAAASVNGDVLAGITAADVSGKTAAYRQIADTLTTVKNAQKDSDIKYIYTTTRVNDKYVFTVDPDPIKPAEYGKEVVYTVAQDTAWAGQSDADEEPYEDEWGCYYTAWSPVKDSSGRVVGIVGVDFAADWYDAQMAKNTRIILLVSVLSLVVGALIMVLLTGQLRRRFRTLNAELSTLSRDVGTLSDEIKARPGDEQQDEEEAEGADTIGAISNQIRTMQKKLKAYMEYAHEQAYTDSMTGVGNKTAYLDRIKALGQEINAGTAAFAIAVFDINGLKSTNDNYGHECGDRIIIDAAAVIRRVFADEQIYRIGGDEFIAVLGPTTESELEGRFEQLTAEVANFNLREKRYAMTLSFSHGGAVYRPGRDADFKEVFKRADEAMYRNKGDYYRLYGDRRRPSDENDK